MGELHFTDQANKKSISQSVALFFMEALKSHARSLMLILRTKESSDMVGSTSGIVYNISGVVDNTSGIVLEFLSEMPGVVSKMPGVLSSMPGLLPLNEDQETDVVFQVVRKHRSIIPDFKVYS